MEAQAWTAIGLLAATLLGSHFYLGNRIDNLGMELRTELRAQGARIDAQGARIDAQGARFDALSAQIHEQGIMLGNRLYDIAVKLDDHLRRHAG
ncbi:MAG: hypothetical protein ACRDJI_00430 [Actinomycetota bacterium]